MRLFFYTYYLIARTRERVCRMKRRIFHTENPEFEGLVLINSKLLIILLHSQTRIESDLIKKYWKGFPMHPVFEWQKRGEKSEKKEERGDEL